MMEIQEASPDCHVFSGMLLGPSLSEISGSDPSGFIEVCNFWLWILSVLRINRRP